MIAGSYISSTTQRLTGAWAWGMTGAVWALALGAGAGVGAGKLFARSLGRKFWVGLYLALGWIAVVAIQPLMAGVSVVALTLLLAEGVVSSLGVIVNLDTALPFRRAVWHGFVTIAAATHSAAILTGVVLPSTA